MFVKIDQGYLEGRKSTSMTTGVGFYSFFNIPYAEPPVGELRFRPPVPARGWMGLRDATYEGNRCLQILKDFHHPSESEDCLYLNVFTPEVPNRNAELKPVMVYIHGGGYYSGDGSTETAAPDNLINYDVVVVTLNFRLHVFGFLNMNTHSSRGNCGNKDQVMALRWVQENIQSFGGDPENVTIFGDSSGGNSVHLLTISPMAAGLFHKAIVGSGSIISTWTRQDQVDVGFEIGRHLGFSGTDPEQLVKFLQKQSASTLSREAKLIISTQRKNTPMAMNATMVFVPSIETYKYGAFLPDYPINLISKSLPVPILAGVAEREGVAVLFGLDDYKKALTPLKDNLVDLVRLNIPCDQSNLIEITEKVINYYFNSLGANATDDEIYEKLLEIYSHLYFMNFYDIIELTAKAITPAYVFKFDFVGQLNESQHSNMPFSGAFHADHSHYVMISRNLRKNSRNFHRKGIHLEASALKTMDTVCAAWTNFARYSNPNPLPYLCDEWKSFKLDDPSYMLFDDECECVARKIWEKGLEFWKQIFMKYVNWQDPRNQKWKL